MDNVLLKNLILENKKACEYINSFDAVDRELQVGCRNMKPKSGAIGIDYYCKPPWFDKYPERFIKANCLNMEIFPNEFFGKVKAIHVFEHIPKFDREKALIEWWRVLKDDGLMYIYVPNQVQYIQNFLTRSWDMDDFSKMTFGLQTRVGEFHHWAYDLTTLPRLVTKILGKECIVEIATEGHRGQWRWKNMEIRTIFRKKINV